MSGNGPSTLVRVKSSDGLGRPAAGARRQGVIRGSACERPTLSVTVRSRIDYGRVNALRRGAVKSGVRIGEILSVWWTNCPAQRVLASLVETI